MSVPGYIHVHTDRNQQLVSIADNEKIMET